MKQTLASSPVCEQPCSACRHASLSWASRKLCMCKCFVNASFALGCGVWFVLISLSQSQALGWHLLAESSLLSPPRPKLLRSACWLCPSYTSSHIRVFSPGPWVSFLVGCGPRRHSELPEGFLATVMVGPSITFLTGLKGLNDSHLPLCSLLAPERQ